MKTHKLKTWPEPFQAVKSGRKRAEIRVNDRDFEVGDALHLQEFIPCSVCGGTRRMWDSGDKTGCTACIVDGVVTGGKYTGDELHKIVSHITDLEPWIGTSGRKKVMLSLYDVEEEKLPMMRRDLARYDEKWNDAWNALSEYGALLGGETIPETIHRIFGPSPLNALENDIHVYPFGEVPEARGEQPEHELDGLRCWCAPRVIMEEGIRIVVHNEVDVS